MNFDTQKFFIGLMDFFSILLPGALLTYLLMGEVSPVVLGNRHATLAGAQAWADFLFASYLFGHLLLLRSWPDEFYDRHTALRERNSANKNSRFSKSCNDPDRRRLRHEQDRLPDSIETA